jgi:hypothetical protein
MQISPDPLRCAPYHVLHGFNVLVALLAQPANAQENSSAMQKENVVPPAIPTPAFSGRSESKRATLSPDGVRLVFMTLR